MLGHLLPGNGIQGLLSKDEHRCGRVHGAVRAAEPLGAVSKQRAFCRGGQRGGGGGWPDLTGGFQGWLFAVVVVVDRHCYCIVSMYVMNECVYVCMYVYVLNAF